MQVNSNMQPRAACIQHLEPNQHVGFGFQPLNYSNLASHTTASLALKQHFVGSRDSSQLRPPTSVCGKRSRSNSDAFASTSSPSSYDSVISPSNAHSESGYESQTSLELSPFSRKGSSGESQQQLAALSDWRSSLNAIDASHSFKKVKCDGGKVVELAQPRSEETTSSSSVSAPSIPSDISSSSSTASSSSPSSVGTDGKIAFVDNLVDAAVRTLDSIWNVSATGGSTWCDLGERQTGLPLHIFVRETLRRGRTSCSTLQAALLYCVRLSQVIQRSKLSAAPLPADMLAIQEAKMINCPRRMFLAAVMVSSKFLQDRTYSNRAWAKVSGLPVRELGKMERSFLAAINYRLMVSKGEWEEWVAKLMKAPAAEQLPGATRRSSLSRSTSDNVTGASIPLDTELRAASPQVESQCHPKYRNFTIAVETQASAVFNPEVQISGSSAELSLPYPMMSRVASAQM